MAAKAILFACASAFFIQTAVSQCFGRMGPAMGPLRTDIAFDGLAYDGLAYGPAWNTGRLGCGAIAPAYADIAAASSLNAAYGGGLPVASASAAAPTGLAVTSENAYEGAVAVAGNLPFLGTVSMAGEFPTVGAGAVSYGCGDGAVAITAEGPIAGPAATAPMAPLATMGPAAAYAPYGAAYGYNGIPARTCGCGAAYELI